MQIPKGDAMERKLELVPDPEPVPDMNAYWDGIAPLPSPADDWSRPRTDAPRTPAQIAREVRLMGLAAEQVAESRAARGVL